ncbi:hypothetical protein Tco_1115427, partial [Tanacetum coccineum]
SQLYAGNVARGNATETGVIQNTGNDTTKIIQCYNCKGDTHFARQCTQPKKAHNSAWFKEKMLLAQVQEARIIFDEEQLALLANTRNRVDSGTDAYTLTTNAIFQTYDIDSFDSNCDEVPATQAYFMANLFDYGSDVLSEVPNYNTYHDNIVFEQNVQDLKYSEQPVIDDDLNIEITSDSNVISYAQYLKESENEVVQINESLTAELEGYKEKIKNFEQRQKFDLTDREKCIDGQMQGIIVDRNAKFVDFENQIQTLKLQLSTIVESYKTLLTTVDVLKNESKAKEDKYLDDILYLEKKWKALDNVVYKWVNQRKRCISQRKVLALYCGHTIVKKHDALSVLDTEETLILAEKQNDPIVKEKKVDITPIDYVALNKLFEHFVKHLVPQKQLSTEQAFWLPISKPVYETPPIQQQLVLKEIPYELPTISLVKDSFNKMRSHVNKFEEYFHMFDKGLAKEIIDMKGVFTQIKTEVAECSIERKCFKIKEKDFLLENERLLEHINCQDVMCIVMHADIEHNKCVVPTNDNNLAYAELGKSYIAEYSKVLELEVELVKKKDD